MIDEKKVYSSQQSSVILKGSYRLTNSHWGSQLLVWAKQHRQLPEARNSAQQHKDALQAAEQPSCGWQRNTPFRLQATGKLWAVAALRRNSITTVLFCPWIQQLMSLLNCKCTSPLLSCHQSLCTVITRAPHYKMGVCSLLSAIKLLLTQSVRVMAFAHLHLENKVHLEAFSSSEEVPF